MTVFLKNNLLVFFLYLVLLIMAFSLILNYDKVIVHIYLNQFVGNAALNFFFYYITYLGDGLIAPFILILIVLYNVRLGLYATFSFLSATLFSQILKRFFFDDAHRPFYVFQWIRPYPIHYVEGVEKYIHNSFPSGHATQVFSIFMCLAFVSKKSGMKFLFFVLAVSTAISRVYLSQHWLTDITVGSLIGMFFSLLFYYLVIGRDTLKKLNTPLTGLKKT